REPWADIDVFCRYNRPFPLVASSQVLMSDDTHDSNDALTSLRERLALYEARQALNDEADDALEQSIRARWPLDRTIAPLLPMVCRHTGAQAAWVRTFDERLELTDFFHEPDGECFERPTDTLYNRVQQAGRYIKLLEDSTVVAQILDVAGEAVGVAALWLDRRVEPEHEQQRLSTLLDVWCEELDNYLAALALARHKHRVTRAISDALKEPVLDDGVNEAIRIIFEQIDFKEMVLVFRHEDDLEGTTLHYKIVRNGVIEHDSSAPN